MNYLVNAKFYGGVYWGVVRCVGYEVSRGVGDEVYIDIGDGFGEVVEL